MKLDSSCGDACRPETQMRETVHTNAAIYRAVKRVALGVLRVREPLARVA